MVGLKKGIITGRNEVVAKVMFLHVSVILFTGGGLRRTPRDQADPPWQGDPLGPGRPPQQGEPPWQGEPPRTKENPPGTRQTPPRDQADTPPAGRTPPHREEDCSLRSMSGRYASYWNAFLSLLNLLFSVFVEHSQGFCPYYSPNNFFNINYTHTHGVF